MLFMPDILMFRNVGQRKAVARPTWLARLAQVLLLTTAERAYLFELATRPDPEQSRIMMLHPIEPVLRSVELMACPAYVLDRRWDVVAANTPAKTLFLSWGIESMLEPLICYGFYLFIRQQSY